MTIGNATLGLNARKPYASVNLGSVSFSWGASTLTSAVIRLLSGWLSTATGGAGVSFTGAAPTAIDATLNAVVELGANNLAGTGFTDDIIRLTEGSRASGVAAQTGLSTTGGGGTNQVQIGALAAQTFAGAANTTDPTQLCRVTS